MTEEGYIGKEFITPDSEMERRCLVIAQVVLDGDFSLEEALQLYGVTKEDYTTWWNSRSK